MERPWFDQAITSAVKTLESAELSRVKASSEVPSEANGGWAGEPQAWADSGSLVQQVSSISQVGPAAQLKQFIADRLAGDYDRASIGKLIDEKITSHKVMMFSFSTCPFCLRAKTLLSEVYGEQLEIYECDLEPGGNAVRAELGRLTGRTSMPSTWLGPDVLLGGCNDGGLGGVATLHSDAKLGPLLAQREEQLGGPLDSALRWFASLGQPDKQQLTLLKSKLYSTCDSGPPNGVGATEEQQTAVKDLASELQQSCSSAPARMPLKGVWELLYSTAPGGSNGKVGPFIGSVTQTFVDDLRFVNAVELFGALKVSLEAEREVLDDSRIRVVFKDMAFSLFGLELFRKAAGGSGVWQQRYVDQELRVMDTPSLFVLRRRLN